MRSTWRRTNGPRSKRGGYGKCSGAAEDEQLKIVTIDGPAGAGKSTVARQLAQRLGFRLLDTGAMYRSVALAALERELDWDDPDALVALAKELHIELGEAQVLVDGQDVTRAIRTSTVTSVTHYAANNPGVRAHLVELQRESVVDENVIAEGRDQGTVVFPHAACKIYLTASPEERARRRAEELAARGEHVAYEQVLANQNLRDRRDSTRVVGRLMPAADALEVCTDGFTTEEVVARLEHIVRDRMANSRYLGRDMAERGLAKILWYQWLQLVCRVVALGALNVRCRGRELVPKTGGGLVLSNHQSHLDPVLIGLASDRRMNFLARQTLFKFAPLGWLIDSLDAIPIDREGSGLGGLKETLKRLKRHELVLMFPEGTRTPDGEMHPFKPGFCALARRAGVPLVPVGIDGAFDSWPRRRNFPQPATVHIQFGEPLLQEQIGPLSDDALVAEIEARVRRCHATAREARRRAMGAPVSLQVITGGSDCPRSDS